MRAFALLLAILFMAGCCPPRTTPRSSECAELPLTILPELPISKLKHGDPYHVVIEAYVQSLAIVLTHDKQTTSIVKAHNQRISESPKQ